MPHPSATCSCPAAGPPRPARLSLILAPSGALGPKVAGLFGTSSAGRWRSGQPGSQACLSSVFPGAAEWGSLVEMKQLTGRAILFGVCIQSCQFRFPFHLLNQELCRSKCQAGFKAEDCAEPQAAITLPAPSYLLSGSSHCRH